MTDQFLNLHCRYCHVETNTTTMGLCDVCVGKVLRFLGVDRLIAQWRDEADRLEHRRGQMTREKRGHEVLSACAHQLEALLLERNDETAPTMP